MFKAKILIPIKKNTISLPLFANRVACGFPSPADDYLESTIDLNDLLISNVPSTFLIYATGESMINAGIMDGDILIVDRSLKPKHKDIIVAIINGDFLVKRLYMQDSKVWLCSENRNFPKIEINSNTNFEIWGVVTNAIHRLR